MLSVKTNCHEAKPFPCVSAVKFSTCLFLQSNKCLPQHHLTLPHCGKLQSPYPSKLPASFFTGSPILRAFNQLRTTADTRNMLRDSPLNLQVDTIEIWLSITPLLRCWSRDSPMSQCLCLTWIFAARGLTYERGRCFYPPDACRRQTPNFKAWLLMNCCLLPGV